MHFPQPVMAAYFIACSPFHSSVDGALCPRRQLRREKRGAPRAATGYLGFFADLALPAAGFAGASSSFL